MTRVIHIDELSHPADKSSLFACQYLSLILLVTMLHPNIHNKDTHYSLSKHLLFTIKTLIIHYQNIYYWLYQILAPPIPYSLKARHIAIFKLIHQLSSQNRRFLISHLTLSFSIQSTFRERRFIIHLKYFLQIYPPKIWWIQKSSTFAPTTHTSYLACLLYHHLDRLLHRMEYKRLPYACMVEHRCYIRTKCF